MSQWPCSAGLRAWLAGPLILLWLAAAGPGRAEPPSAGASGLVALDPVMVTAPRVAAPLERVPAAVSVVTAEEIESGRPAVSLEAPLNRVPGVFATNPLNFAQGLRVSIRGFGNRAAFGIRGIRVLLDGIPLTLPDGQSQTDAIDPDAIERIEVMRGPSSALYGNAAGGVISVHTQDGPPEPTLGARTTTGDLGLWKMQAAAGGQVGPLNYCLNARRLSLEGFRDHARAESYIVHGKLRYDLGPASSLTAVVNWLDSPVAEDPGGLTAGQVAADRTQAAPLARQFRTRETVDQALTGLLYRREASPGQDLEVRGFYIHRDLDNAIPFSFVQLERDVTGGGAQYALAGGLPGPLERLVAGVDVEYMADGRVNFNNVSGEPGSEVELRQDESVPGLGPYAQAELRLTPELGLVFVRFEVDDELLSDGDQSGSRTFDRLTGRFGLIYSPRPELNLYASVAQSFETPTTTELVNRPDGLGGLNPDLQPQTATNYEVGAKGQGGERLLYDLAAYYIALDNEFIAFRGEEDRVFFRNAGESRRYGLEVGLSARLPLGLSTRLAYSFIRAEFVGYEKGGLDLGGNEVPGLPPQQLFAELFWRRPSGLYAGLDLLWVDAFFADDENLAKNGASVVCNLWAGWDIALGAWRVSPFVGVRNLSGEDYNGNVRINVNGGRFFEPAPGRGPYGGLGLAYSFRQG